MKKIIILTLLCMFFLVSTVSGALTDGLVAYFSFDVSAKDDTNNGNNGTFNDNAHVNFTNKKCGAGSLQLDGTNDYVNVPDTLFNTQSASQSLWINTDNNGLTQSMGRQWSSPNFNFILRIDAGGQIEFFIRDSNNNNILAEWVQQINTSQWYYVTAVTDLNTNNSLLYVNADLKANITITVPPRNTSSSPNLNIGADEGGNTGEWDGNIDEYGYWNRSLTGSEISSLYNGGSCLNPIAVIKDSNITFFFVNESNKNNLSASKVLFNEGEDFYIYLNWTNTSGQINGQCNITSYGAIAESELKADKLFICSGAGCNASSYTENVTTENTNPIEKDFIHFHVCHNNLANRDLNVSISCNGSTITESTLLLSTQIPTCASGAIEFNVELNACNNFTEINITFSNNAPSYSQGHNITGSAFDREFVSFLHVFGDSVLRNSTTGLYYVTHSHEFYEHGQKNISATCKNNTVNHIKTQMTNITIVNLAPQIIFDIVKNPCGQFNLVDNGHYQYCDGDWNFSVLIVDDDADFLNATFRCQNASGAYQLIANYSGPVVNASFIVDSKLFVDFVDPFNNEINCTGWVFVNDSFGANTTRSQNITINDTITPICLNITNATILNNTNYTWNVQCIDEHFYSFNVTCSGGSTFNFSRKNINATEYNFTNTSLITGNTTCFFEYCDGHTNKKIKIKDPIINDEKTKLTFKVKDKNYNFSYEGSYDSELIAIREYDRIKFRFINKDENNKDKLKTYFFKYSTPSGEYIPSFEYQAWIVDLYAKLWFDLNNDINETISVSEVKKGEFDFQLETYSNNITFYSIGELNCKNTTQYIYLSPTNVTINQTFQVAECPNTIPSALMFGIIVIIALCFIVVGIFSKVKIIGFLGSLMLAFFSYTIVGCSEGLGLILLVSGVIMSLYFILAGIITFATGR